MDFAIKHSRPCQAAEKGSWQLYRRLAGQAYLGITSLDPVDITERLQTGSLTSVEVVTAFCKRSAISHQLVGIELVLKFPIG